MDRDQYKLPCPSDQSPCGQSASKSDSSPKTQEKEADNCDRESGRKGSPNAIHILANLGGVRPLQLAQLCIPLDFEEYFLSCLCRNLSNRRSATNGVQNETRRRVISLLLSRSTTEGPRNAP